MKTQAELNKIEVDIDYYDVQSIVEGFFKLSAFNRMNEFNFEEAFEYLGGHIRYKLLEHAQDCTKEEYIEYNIEHGFASGYDFSPFVIETGYVSVDEGDVKEALFGLWYEKSHQAFDGMFDDLIEIYSLSSVATNSEDERKDNVILFDRVINAQHITGDIFEDLDIEDMKADLDEEIIELMDITVSI